MKKIFMTKIIGLAFLSFAFLFPTGAKAVPQFNLSFQVYDRQHKDYHTFDEVENQHWQSYQSARREKPKDFRRASKREQGQFWEYHHQDEGYHRGR